MSKYMFMICNLTSWGNLSSAVQEQGFNQARTYVLIIIVTLSVIILQYGLCSHYS